MIRNGDEVFRAGPRRLMMRFSHFCRPDTDLTRSWTHGIAGPSSACIDKIFSVSRGNDENDVDYGLINRNYRAASWYQAEKI